LTTTTVVFIPMLGIPQQNHINHYMLGVQVSIETVVVHDPEDPFTPVLSPLTNDDVCITHETSCSPLIPTLATLPTLDWDWKDFFETQSTSSSEEEGDNPTSTSSNHLLLDMSSSLPNVSTGAGQDEAVIPLITGEVTVVLTKAANATNTNEVGITPTSDKHLSVPTIWTDVRKKLKAAVDVAKEGHSAVAVVSVIKDAENVGVGGAKAKKHVGTSVDVIELQATAQDNGAEKGAGEFEGVKLKIEQGKSEPVDEKVTDE